MGRSTLAQINADLNALDWQPPLHRVLRKTKPGPKRQKVDYSQLAQSKGPTRKTLKGRKRRAEDKVKGLVRAHVEARDGFCVLNRLGYGDVLAGDLGDCEGFSEWAHTAAKRRSQTRNQAPEIRHTTHDSFKACTKHHDMYDGRRRPRLFVTALTRKGCDGGLKVWVRA